MRTQRKILSLLLAACMVLTMAPAAFAEENSTNYVQNEDHLVEMLDYVEKEELDIQLTDNYFAVDDVKTHGNYIKLKFESDNEEEIQVLACAITDEASRKDYGLDPVRPFNPDYQVITVSEDQSAEVTSIRKNGIGAPITTLITHIDYFAFDVLTENVTKETTITLSVYIGTASSTATLKKTVTYTLSPSQTGDAGDNSPITMEVSGEDRSTPLAGYQAYNGDTVTVNLSGTGDFDGSQAILTVSGPFELEGDCPTGWSADENAYSYTNTDGGSNTEDTAFTFKVNCSDSDSQSTYIQGAFTLKCKYDDDNETVTTEKVTIITKKQIQYTIESEEDVIHYDGKEHSLDVKVTEPEKTQIFWSIPDSDQWTEGVPSIKNCGDGLDHEYLYRIKIEADGYRTVEKTISYGLLQAMLTIKPDDVTIYVGDEVPKDFTYTIVSGQLFGDDKLITEPTFTTDCTDTSEAGTYKITAKGASAGDNYSISYRKGVLTVAAKPESVTLDQTELTLYSNTTPNTYMLTATVTPDSSGLVTWTSSNEAVAKVENGVVTAVANGTATITATAGDCSDTCTVTVTTYVAPSIGGGGSSTPTYSVTAPKADNGTVTVSPRNARKGAEVTITVKPDPGYEVDEVTVTDKNGKTIKVTEGRNGKYTFTMPASKVDVEVTFVKEYVAPAISFDDVSKGAWYYDAAIYAAENGIMSGTGGNNFSPDMTTSRAMIWTILARLDGQNVSVVYGNWYDKAQMWAMTNRVSDGTNPNGSITREQLAVMLYSYAQANGYTGKAGVSLSRYLDASETSAWAVEAMEWAVGNGLISSTGGNLLSPTATATRAQVAVILMNFCENLVK